MKKTNGKSSKGWILLLLVLFILIIVAASFGAANLSLKDSVLILLTQIPGLEDKQMMGQLEEVYIKIIWQVRMPRILLAGLTGCGLSIVGATFQAIFKNPLADPHILGISSGAALGATVAMLTGVTIPFLGFGMVGAFAFLGALLTVLLVYQITCIGNKISTTNIILTGTAISTMFSSVISLLMSFHHDQIEKVYLWTLGSFSAATWNKVGFLTVFVVIAGLVILFFQKELDVITIGNDTAQSVGIDLPKTRKILIVFASLLVAACVSVSGIIGFVGLIIPHCMRILFGPKHKKLLPLSALGGAIFMIFCDTLGRNLVAPSEIPVGVITAIIGTPYFIFLLQHNKKKLGIS